jgi:membrane-associated phospholipid phosphatase
MLISAVAQAIADGMSQLRPLKYDLFIYQFDAWFGQPSFALGRIVQRHIWLEVILQIAYGIMPNVVAAALAAYIYLAEAELPIVLKAFAINLLAAPAFYLMLPVCGPQFAFPHFPQAAVVITARLIPLTAAPNGFPSVHTSTALLVLLITWRWWPGRALGILYLGLIVITTLASGQHYLFDLLAAVPYALIVARIAGLLRHRVPACGVQSVSLSRGSEQFP